MKILITGSTGFVGKALIKELLTHHDHELVLLVRNPENIHFNNCIVISLMEEDWKKQVKAANAEIVIHLASFLTSADDERSIENLIESNLLFGTQLLNALAGTQIQYFINTGTFAEYLTNEVEPVPAYLYAATKTAFRSILKYYQLVHGFKVINIIPYTIYGGAGTQRKLIDIIYQSIKSKEAINMSPGEQVLDFIHLDDVVGFYQSLLSNLEKITEESIEFRLGTGIGTTPKQIAQIVEDKTLKPTNINWGGVPYRKMDTMYSVAIDEKLWGILKWKAEISLVTGIGKYLNSISSHE